MQHRVLLFVCIQAHTGATNPQACRCWHPVRRGGCITVLLSHCRNSTLSQRRCARAPTWMPVDPLCQAGLAVASTAPTPIMLQAGLCRQGHQSAHPGTQGLALG